MSGDAIDLDTLLDLCRSEPRRIVLAVLADEQRSLTLGDLTKSIVKHDHHEPLSEVSGEEVKRIRTELHHVHVPKLADAGLVEYEPERHLVDPTPQFDRVEPSLSKIFEADPALTPPVEM